MTHLYHHFQTPLVNILIYTSHNDGSRNDAFTGKERDTNEKNNDPITDSTCRRQGRTVVPDPLRCTMDDDLSNRPDPPV